MELFHVLNRGIDKRAIAMDDRDRVRFVHDLYALNDARAVNNLTHTLKNKDIASPYFVLTADRKPLVTIHGWCLMSNHYHLLLSARTPDDITRFIRKFNIGYVKYFNERHERSGTLFQSRTKRVSVARNAYFLYVLHYIHLNPLDMHPRLKTWREGSLKGVATALNKLSEYRWSSFLDYNNVHNFPSVISRDLYDASFATRGGYARALRDYIQDMESERLENLAARLE